MYDMVEALRFIKAHIHHFGGDPERITLVGQSAGSAAVTHLMVSPMIKDERLFTRAIAMSGSALNEWATGSPEEAEKASLKVAELVSCYDPSVEYNPADVVSCMQSVDFRVLTAKLAEYQAGENRLGRLGLGPVKPVVQISGAEPRFLTERPEAILERHEQADIPLIMGTTRHDGSFVLGTEYNKFIKVNGYEEDEVFLRSKLVPTLLQALGLQDSTGVVYDALASLYLGKYAKASGNFTLMIPGLTDLHSVFFFNAGALRTLLLHSQLQSQSYWYNFAYKGRFSVYGTLVQTSGNPVRGGVGHGDDLLYLFNIPTLINLPDADLAVSKRLIDYWVNFAATGNPNTGEDGSSSKLNEEEWPVYSEDHPSFAVINGQDEIISALPNDYWLGVTDELYPELDDTTTTTTTTTETETTTDEDDNTEDYIDSTTEGQLVSSSTTKNGDRSTDEDDPVDATTPDSSLPTTSAKGYHAGWKVFTQVAKFQSDPPVLDHDTRLAFINYALNICPNDEIFEVLNAKYLIEIRSLQAKLSELSPSDSAVETAILESQEQESIMHDILNKMKFEEFVHTTTTWINPLKKVAQVVKTGGGAILAGTGRTIQENIISSNPVQPCQEELPNENFLQESYPAFYITTDDVHLVHTSLLAYKYNSFSSASVSNYVKSNPALELCLTINRIWHLERLLLGTSEAGDRDFKVLEQLVSEILPEDVPWGLAILSSIDDVTVLSKVLQSVPQTQTSYRIILAYLSYRINKELNIETKDDDLAAGNLNKLISDTANLVGGEDFLETHPDQRLRDLISIFYQYQDYLIDPFAPEVNGGQDIIKGEKSEADSDDEDYQQGDGWED
ncbi:unnamed protein product [Allacma fusca]|uniref:Carboxylesterase type B domain-containing protein n=1 Tax=Allacma fusca TaxID=39272 RepID=A0A8J2J315_9HEXA|nr:unnamed protein product [Allacma fusca]